MSVLEKGIVVPFQSIRNTQYVGEWNLRTDVEMEFRKWNYGHRYHLFLRKQKRAGEIFLGSEWMREGANHAKHNFQKGVFSQGRGLVQNIPF